MFQVKKYLQPIALFLSVFSFWFLLFYFQLEENLTVSIQSHKQILKAFGWLNGAPGWLGPELPYSGGNLTGPFFYFLLLPPLLFKTSYTAVIIWLLSWLSLTYTVAFFFIKSATKHILSPPLFLMLLVSSPLLIGNLFYYDWNNLFSLFFHLALLICLYEWRLKKRDSFLYLIGLLLGLGVQVHYSVLFHCITLILFVIADWRPKKPESVMAFSGCLTLFLLPQLPWLGALMSDRIYAPEFNWYHIIYILDQFLQNPEKWVLGLLESLGLLAWGKKWHIGGILALLVFFVALKKRKRESEKNIYREESPFILSLILIMPILGLFPSLYGDKGLFFIPLFAIMVFVKWMDAVWPERASEKYGLFVIYGLVLFFPALIYSLNKGLYFKNIHELVLLLAGCAFISTSYFGLFSLKTFNKLKVSASLLIFVLLLSSYNVLPSPEAKKEFTYSMKEIVSFLVSQGEDAKEVLKKMFQVGMNGNDFLFSSMLTMESSSWAHSKNNSNKNQESKQNQEKTGYFIVYDKKNKKGFSNYSMEDWESYLSSDTFPEEIQKEISEGKLQIKRIDFKSNRWIINYSIESDSIFQEGFHNVETTFAHYKETSWVEETCYFPSFLRDKNKFYLCSISPGYLERVAILIEFLPIGSSSFIKVSFAGHPLTITSRERKNSHLIEDINLEMECPQKKSVGVLSHIGLNKNKSEHSKSFFAPLTVTIPINCDLKSLKKLVVHFKRKREYRSEEKLSYIWPVSAAVKPPVESNSNNK